MLSNTHSQTLNVDSKIFHHLRNNTLSLAKNCEE